MKLRLLLFEDCNRRCKGCCNKDWDLSILPVVKHYSKYERIMLTGGEPMLHPDIVLKTIASIRLENPKIPIYVYTAKVDGAQTMDVLRSADGFTVTLHEQADAIMFLRFDSERRGLRINKKSLRLNIFEGVTIYPSLLAELASEGWKIKKNMKWIKNSPLPTDEVFMRLKKPGVHISS